VGNEDESLAIVEAARRAADGVGRDSDVGADDALAPFGDSFLQHEAAVVLGLCGLDVEGCGFRKLMETLEDRLEFIGAEQVVEFAAPGGDEEEDAPEGDTQLVHERDDGVYFADVAAAEGGVDLHRQAGFVGPLHGVERARVGAGHSAKGVVSGGSGAVEADREARQAGLLETEDNIAGEKRRSAGREGNVNTDGARVIDEFEEVGALDGVAAGEDEDGDLPGCDLVDERFAFIRRQLGWVALGLGRGAAMDAGEVACLGDFPYGDKRALVEINGLDLRVHKTDQIRPERRMQ